MTNPSLFLYIQFWRIVWATLFARKPCQQKQNLSILKICFKRKFREVRNFCHIWWAKVQTVSLQTWHNLQSRYLVILCEKLLCYSGFISSLNTGLWHRSSWGQMPLTTPIPYPLNRDHTFTFILPHPAQTSNSMKYFIHSNESLQSFHMQEFGKTSFVIEQLWDALLTFFHHMRWSTSVLWNKSETSFSVT